MPVTLGKAESQALNHAISTKKFVDPRDSAPAMAWLHTAMCPVVSRSGTEGL
jgi:hypothetical protein